MFPGRLFDDERGPVSRLGEGPHYFHIISLCLFFVNPPRVKTDAQNARNSPYPLDKPTEK